MPLPDLIPTHQLAYTSSGSALASLYANDDNDEILDYGRIMILEHEPAVQHYRNVFSGEKFKKLFETTEIDENTICVVLFVDGYQLKNMQKAHQVMINCLIMDVHPEHRYVVICKLI